MRHRCKRTKLGLTTDHRNELLRGVVNGLVLNNRVRTTVTRAKAAKSLAEQMVTLARKGTLHARRQIVAELHSQASAARLMGEIASLYEGQSGGYTRLIRLGYRAGDGAQMALLEFTRIPQSLLDEKEKKNKQKKERTEKKERRKRQEAAQVEEETPQKPAPKPKEKKKAAKKPEKEAEKKKAKEEEKPDEEKRRTPGFLSGLRRFLKGGE